MHNNSSDIVDDLMREAKRVVLEMSRTKDVNQRKLQSEIAHNLCQSIGVFFNFMTNAVQSADSESLMDETGFEEDDDDDGFPANPPPFRQF